jgi:hypothetical protein
MRKRHDEISLSRLELIAQRKQSGAPGARLHNGGIKKVPHPKGSDGEEKIFRSNCESLARQRQSSELRARRFAPRLARHIAESRRPNSPLMRALGNPFLPIDLYIYERISARPIPLSVVSSLSYFPLGDRYPALR